MAYNMMKNLSKRHKRPSGYVSIFTNVEGYFGRSCTFKKKHPISVVTKKSTWKKLQNLFEMYKKQVSSFQRKWAVLSLRQSFSWEEKSLEESFLFRLFCNGFNTAYKYFSFDNICFMTGKTAIENQIGIYIKSSRVTALEYEPDEYSCDLEDFRSYCYDLGQKEAANYFLAKYLLEERSFKQVDCLKDFFILDKDSERAVSYIDDVVRIGLEYVNSKSRAAAKRAAILIMFLDANSDLKVRVAADKKTAQYNSKIINLIWNELIDKGEGNSFIKTVPRYLTGENKKYKIKEKDIDEFDKILNDNNLK